MDNKPEYVDKIDAWLRGELTKQWSEEFHKSMEENDELKKEAGLIQDIVVGLRAYDEETLRERFKNLGRQQDEQKHRQLKLYTFSAIAAIVVLLISVGIFVKSSISHSVQNKELTAEVLFHKYFQAYPVPSDNMLRGSATAKKTDNASDEAMRCYDAENYKEASRKFALALKQSPSTTNDIFYLGISQLATNQTEPAIHSFLKLESLNQPLYSDHVKWYLALGYLKENKKDKVRHYLKQLIDSQSTYSGPASELMHEMK
ncbi:MAG: hypothetical protein Q8907_03315 [Bacteroidota bacterium]|nr:hypothetical protein [Bacteroidota bacterium]